MCVCVSVCLCAGGALPPYARLGPMGAGEYQLGRRGLMNKGYSSGVLSPLPAGLLLLLCTFVRLTSTSYTPTPQCLILCSRVPSSFSHGPTHAVYEADPPALSEMTHFYIGPAPPPSLFDHHRDSLFNKIVPRPATPSPLVPSTSRSGQ